MKTRLIRICEDDYNRINNEVKQEYLRHHPEMKQISLSKAKLVFEMIEFYLKY